VSSTRSNPASTLPSELLAPLEAGACVITPNERAARNLRRGYDFFMRSRQPVWQTVHIQAWDAWLKRWWNDSVSEGKISGPVLIGKEHALAIWEEKIQHSLAAKKILNISGTAEKAQQAWDLMCRYCIQPDQMGTLQTVESRIFHQWLVAYWEHLQAKNWVDHSQLSFRLQEKVLEGALELHRHIILYAFDELKPAEKSLVESMRAMSCRVEELPAALLPSSPSTLLCDDTSDEVAKAAQWARKILNSNPEASIGMIVPQLDSLRAEIERTFLFTLQPSAFFHPDVDQPRAFDLSLGLSLHAQPLVNVALLVLRLASCELSLTEYSSFLRTPYFAGGDTESGSRSHLEAEMREQNKLSVSLQQLRSAASTPGESFSCPILAECLMKLESKVLPDSKAVLPYSEWSKFFLSCLETMQWPGSRTLGSAEYQSRLRFENLLNEFASLDSLERKVRMTAAVNHLERMATRTLFQPENQGAPIQILGPIESAGSHFDHLWVMGMQDEVWPAAGQPHPFLPLILQREHRMPHGDTASDLAFAQLLTTRMLSSAKHVVLSVPAMEGDRSLRMSPMLTHLTASSAPELGLDRFDIHAADAAPTSEWREPGFPHPDLSEGEIHNGGTRIFQFQAACPFRAFAELRLHAGPLQEPVLGADAKVRGTLAHHAMYAIWDELKTSAQLRELSEEKRAALVTRVVASSIRQEKKLRGEAWYAEFRTLEQERLQDTVQAMLQLDLERTIPFEVEQREQLANVEIGGVHMSIRKDRVDRLADGSCVIVDYKSSAKTAKTWEGERPDEPQIPVYAVTEHGNIAAVAFAILESGKISYKGYAETDDVLPSLKAFQGDKRNNPAGQPLAQHISQWNAPLAALAEEYRAGVAEVAPKKRSQTCKHCTLQTFCRISELDTENALASGEDEGDGDE
jgi:ATP-dependent helicase/nuclease subunit B